MFAFPENIQKKKISMSFWKIMPHLGFDVDYIKCMD